MRIIRWTVKTCTCAVLAYFHRFRFIFAIWKISSFNEIACNVLSETHKRRQRKKKWSKREPESKEGKTKIQIQCRQTIKWKFNENKWVNEKSVKSYLARKKEMKWSERCEMNWNIFCIVLLFFWVKNIVFFVIRKFQHSNDQHNLDYLISSQGTHFQRQLWNLKENLWLHFVNHRKSDYFHGNTRINPFSANRKFQNQKLRFSW